jgi:hypothetical protein
MTSTITSFFTNTLPFTSKDSERVSPVKSYWSRATEEDLQKHPSRKREYQLQQYLLQSYNINNKTNDTSVIES